MNNRLKAIVRFAYLNVPFYKRLYKQYIDLFLNDEIEFASLPTVEKSDIAEAGLNLISEKFYSDFVEHTLIKYHTSGSTGICLDIYWREKDVDSSLLGLWFLRKKYYDISPGDKCCAFYANRREGYEEPKQVRYKHYLAFSKSNLDDKRLCEIYHEMMGFQPKYLIVEPSIALLLCECKKKYKLNPIDSIQYIELTGEYLFEEIRGTIEEGFQCITANQYGAYEVNSIAYECPEGNMHCMTRNIFAEILDDTGNRVNDGEEGNIYVTSLTNRAMPFIRYKIGDRGRLCFDRNCKCGNSAPVIKLTGARSNDFIICEDGIRIHSSVFVKVIENVNKVMGNPIQQFQIKQVSYHHFIVKLVLAFEDVDIQKLINTFGLLFEEERLLHSDITFEFYDCLFPDDNTGKLYYFVSSVNK